MDNLEEINKFLKTYKLSRSKQKETEKLNRLITCKEIELVIKKLWINKSPGPVGFTSIVYQTCKEVLVPILLKWFQKIEKEEKLPNSCMRLELPIPKPDKDFTK